MYCTIHTAAASVSCAGRTWRRVGRTIGLQTPEGEMTTDLSQLPITSRPTPLIERRISKPRLVVLACDPDMVEVLGDVLADDYEVSAPPHPASIGAISAEEPDAVLIGTLAGGLTPDELVALMASHMLLHGVPVVVMSAQPDVLGHAGRMPHLAGVTLLSLPVDVETVRLVVEAAIRKAHRPTSGRLADLCPHGFDVASESCRRCAIRLG